MSSFIPKYGREFPGNDFSNSIPKDYFQQAQYPNAKSFPNQMDLVQAEFERDYLERQINALCSTGIPKMNMGYVGSQKTFGEGPHIGQRYGVGNANFNQPNRGHSVPAHFVNRSGREMNDQGAPVIPKYAQRSIAPENGYLSAPVAQVHTPAAMNPYYYPNHQTSTKFNKPNASHIPIAPNPMAGTPTPPVASTASGSPPSDLPVIKIRGWGNRGPPSGHTIVYEVQFKRGSRHFVPGPRCPPLLAVGEFVVTQCTRGENLGVVTEILTMHQLQQRRFEAHLIGIEGEEGEGNLSQIVRVASLFERQSLPRKHSDELQTLEMTVDLARNKYNLVMDVVDCEFQFDHAKLTIYYQCESRVDFRELVKELCAILKIRIWMKEVSKPVASVLNQKALKALATGATMTI